MSHHRRYHRPLRDHIHRERDEDMFRSPNPKRFYRSRTDKVWLGVCGGLAERFGWEPSLVRILFVIAFFSIPGPVVLIAYVVGAMITPKEPIGRPNLAPEEEQFWRNVSDQPRVTASGLKYTFMDLEERLRNIERNVTSEEWRLKKAFRDLEQN
ncbi:MAG: envelope stress response membrane protein PspC [Pseudomonadota bacterium]|nr:envelope stress response membrane protein PspC [Pseudomonadota bacterium]